MPTRVQMPDGKIAEFPDGMKPEDIDAAITTHYSATPQAAAAAAANPFGNAPAHAPAPPVTGTAAVLQRMAAPDPTPISNIAKGAIKSIGNSANNIGHLALPDAAAKTLGLPVPTAQQQDSYFAPANTGEAVGKAAGDVGQFFLPGPGEELGAAKLAPYVGKYLPFVKMGLAGAGSAAVTKAEGGNAGSGFFGGALGSALGHGIQKVAPALAETALGVRAADRAYGRTPGQFIVEETTGSDPGKIAEQAGNIATRDTARLNQNALVTNTPVDLSPARSTATSFLNTAKLQNNPDLIRDVGRVGDQISLRGGVPIPSNVSAYQGLALKRGLNALTDYNPNLTQGLGDAAVKGTVNAMQPELSAAIPEYDALNGRISAAIPVAKRAGAADLNAGVLQRVVGRAAKPTGALIGATGGGYEGYRHGGTGGAILGAGLGLVAPEVLTSPATLLKEARMANSLGPAFGTVANASAQQYLKPKK